MGESYRKTVGCKVKINFAIARTGKGCFRNGDSTVQELDAHSQGTKV